MLHAYDYHTGQGISIMQGPAGAAGMQLLGEEAEAWFYTCDDANVCRGEDEVTAAAFRELQMAINRASEQFPKAGVAPIVVDGVIGPDVLVAAWRLAKFLGPDAHPLLAQIGEVNVMDPTQVGPYAWLLAGKPVAVKTAFDSLSVAQASVSTKHKRTFWALGLTGVALGAVGSALYFGRSR